MTQITTIRRWPRWRLLLWGAATALLLLPFAAMQVTREVAWTAADFVVAALLLFGAAAALEAAWRLIPARRGRIAAGAGIAAALVALWVQGAVGLV